MKKFSKILALILAVVTLLSVMTIPTFAAYNYPMTCTVYYKNEKGKQIALTERDQELIDKAAVGFDKHNQ